MQLSVGAAVINDVRNDFNGDGRSDILWRNVDGQMSNWLGQANGGFVQNNANAAAVVPVAWQIAGTGDFNGDGRDDILWRNVDGQISNWLATAAGGFTQNNANAAAVVPTAWHVVGIGDFNGDGRDDILWRHNDGTVSNWLGTAAGGFTANDGNAARFAPTNWHVVGTGDFNGDGRDDVLWRNDNGQLSNWLGTASGGFTLNDAVALTWSTAWKIAGTGDFNGDGRDDILWRHTDGTISNWLGTGQWRLRQQWRRVGHQRAAGVERGGDRRLQWRRPRRHPVAPYRWHAQRLARHRQWRLHPQRRQRRHPGANILARPAGAVLAIGIVGGAAYRTRTCDPRITNAMLYQLS